QGSRRHSACFQPLARPIGSACLSIRTGQTVPTLLLPKVLSAGLTIVLVGCTILPRGAALEREILGTSRDGAETTTGEATKPSEFEVMPVTRKMLPVYAAWPAVGEEHHTWIKHVGQP